MRNNNWFKERGYLHLNNKISISRFHQVRDYVSDIDKISVHSFSPLIFKEIVQRRYKKRSGNSKVRSHKAIKNNKVVSTKKIRPILYSNHLDAHIHAFYAKRIIGEKYERLVKSRNGLSDCITAYRKIPISSSNEKGKSNIHFAKEIFDEIKDRGNCVAVALDIESFFNNLDHKILKNKWIEVINSTKGLPSDHYNIYKAVTRFSYIKLDDLRLANGNFNEKRLSEIRKKGNNAFFNSYKEFLASGIRIYKNQRKNESRELIGIPQGLPLSAVLANIYMLDFDSKIHKKLVLDSGGFYRRYSDDIIVLCEKDKVSETIEFIESQLNDSKLKLAKDKTDIVYFEQSKENGRLEGFKIIEGKRKGNQYLSYLGFDFYGYQTLIKSKNLASFYRDMKGAIRSKNRIAQKLNKKSLTNSQPLFERKIFHLYSYKGLKKRDTNDNNQSKKNRSNRRSNGNFIKYVYRASKIMNAPEIKKQTRNHWKILRRTISKYDFSNFR